MGNKCFPWAHIKLQIILMASFVCMFIALTTLVPGTDLLARLKLLLYRQHSARGSGKSVYINNLNTRWIFY